MSKQKAPEGKTRVTFANRAVLDGKQYKQGETYDLDPADARHLLHVGKVRLDPEAERTQDGPTIVGAETEPATAGDEK